MRTKLVVANENTLGYIFPETPNTVGRLASKVVSGNPHFNMENQQITKSDKVRLASKQDFDRFRVSFEGYQDHEYKK